jgi:hypothetical protein
MSSPSIRTSGLHSVLIAAALLASLLPTTSALAFPVSARIRTALRTPVRPPKLMDVITPTGVDQSDEVDYTIDTPVVLFGVPIP